MLPILACFRGLSVGEAWKDSNLIDQSSKVEAMQFSIRLGLLAGLLVAVTALSAATVSAASNTTSRSAVNVLEGKVPSCSAAGIGSGAVLLGGPALFGPTPGAGSGPDQQVRNDVFYDAIGSQYIWVQVDGAAPCPGPASTINILSPITSTTCASMESLTLEVTDVDGYNVKDGTELTLSANLGTVVATKTTKDGLATVSYLAPADSSGKAEIIVRAGAIVAIKTLDVSCS